MPALRVPTRDVVGVGAAGGLNGEGLRAAVGVSDALTANREGRLWRTAQCPRRRLPRRLTVERRMAGWPTRSLAEQPGISQPMVDKRLRRYQDEGIRGTSCPHSYAREPPDPSSSPQALHRRTGAALQPNIIRPAYLLRSQAGEHDLDRENCRSLASPECTRSASFPASPLL